MRDGVKKKVCLLGAFGVGKTSLVRRFVYSEFDERYHSTIGVKIDKKVVEAGGKTVTMLLWDVAGEEEFFQIPASYMRGAAGVLLVADGTRPQTLDTAQLIAARVDAEVGAVPRVVLLNKSDLADEWQLAEHSAAQIEAGGSSCWTTSAKSGAGVEAAFAHLARRMVEG